MPQPWSEKSEQTKEKHRGWTRDWKKANPEKVREYRRKAYAKDPMGQLRASMKWAARALLRGGASEATVRAWVEEAIRSTLPDPL